MNKLNSSNIKLEIFIMCYNRTAYLKECINSIIQNSNNQVKVVISDNSNTNSVQEFLSLNTDLLSRIEYIRRTPSMDPIAHGDCLINEATAEYFMMFHDDDILLPHAIEKILKILDNDSTLCAAGANAYIMNGSQKTNNLFMTNNRKALTIVFNKQQMALHYLQKALGHPPFPLFIYRTRYAKLSSMIFDEGMKHADASFLIKLTELGPVAWSNEPLMYYRKHALNGSNEIDIQALLSLVLFINTYCGYSANILLYSISLVFRNILAKLKRIILSSINT